MSYQPSTLLPIRIRFDGTERQYRVEQAYTPTENGAFWPQDLNDIVSLNEITWRLRSTSSTVLEAALAVFKIMHEENVALVDFDLGVVPTNSPRVTLTIAQLERVRF